MKLVGLRTRPSRNGKCFSYFLDYIDLDGKRRRVSLGHADRHRAERQRAQKERELRMGIVAPRSMRLSEFLRDSLSRTGDQIRESTVIDYRSAMQDFIGVVGDMDFRKVTQTDGEKFRQLLLDRGNSPATVAKKLRSIKRFFALAVERDQLDKNPLRYIKPPKTAKKSAKKRIRVYSDDERKRILKAASETHVPKDLDWTLMVRLALTTGMRKSELLNLTWADVDFSELSIEVQPKDSTRETWPWKIKDSDCRTVPLTDALADDLAKLQQTRPDGYPYLLVPPGRYEYIQGHLRPKGKWTLSNPRNKVISNFKKCFDAILAKAHVQHGTFHDLRKTAITSWFRQGLSEHDVMTLAGHSNFRTTHQFYLAVADDLVDRARVASTEFLARSWRAPHTTKRNEEGRQAQGVAGQRLTERGRRDSNPQPSDCLSDRPFRRDEMRLCPHFGEA